MQTIVIAPAPAPAKLNRKARRKLRHKKPKGDSKPCDCRQCRRRPKTPVEWPRHYLGIPIRQDSRRRSPVTWQSFECHLESSSVDPEFAEAAAALRNEPERMGSVLVERRRIL